MRGVRVKTNVAMRAWARGRPRPAFRALRVVFKTFIINTIKSRPPFWFFSLYLNIQEHSLSNVRHQYYKEQDTSRKKQWKMSIKLRGLLSIFLKSFL